ncbi:mediator of RNA polymerase II transcription subunit 30-like [Pocillopora damicornis]|uniref:mediator of RNA polymerase II transcription subunit 30-like n=1 Tax=Pocillopora damicornis TaxID=46731 RepID=UPI000F54CBB8|nr:mediator of RNA polymerase II transcription subunit 30-like [Pocillopora damicornis]
MASKRVLPVGLQSALPVGLSAAMREDKKNVRPTNVQQLNEISITAQGLQTVEEIVSKATYLFRCLQEKNMVVDDKSKQEARNNNKKVQDTLNSLKELFSRLRVFYDESNRRIEIPNGEDLEALIPLRTSEEDSDMETSNDSTALGIEHDTLQEKLRSKNQEIKELIDKLRTLIWDINTMMALKPS